MGVNRWHGRMSSGAAQVTNGLEGLVETIEARFKRILAARSSRQRTLLQQSEGAVVAAVTEQGTAHLRTLKQALQGGLAGQAELLQRALVEALAAQHQRMIEAALAEHSTARSSGARGGERWRGTRGSARPRCR